MAANELQSDGESSPSNTLHPGHSHGHFFVKKNFHKPTYCHHCTDLLWGLIGQGYVCEVCNFVVHDRCSKTVVSPCSSIAIKYVKNPIAHCWSEPGHFKQKFCSVCRKRLEDCTAIRCELCDYYVHLECQDFAVSDCKECSTYTPNLEKGSAKQYHHWREGNLPRNSKCLLCKNKTCWSAECLAGMRCDWCGVTAHTACYKQLPVECSFGCLRTIMVPPYAVSVPRMDMAQEDLVRMPRKQTLPARTVSEEFSSSGDSKTEEDGQEYREKRSPKDKDGRDRGGNREERDEEIVRIYDGNASLRRRVYRTVAVPKNAPAQVLLEAALRTYHISDDPANYYLAEVTDKEGGEQPINSELPLRTQLQSQDGKRPSIFLRYRERDPDRGYIRIYPGSQSKLHDRVSAHYRHVSVTRDSTAAEVVEKSLIKFGIQNEDSANYSLVEVLLDKGVTEREMDSEEKPWQILINKRMESIRANRMMRFYVKGKDDPHGTHVALYIGNLPTSLNQKQYEKILGDICSKGDEIKPEQYRWIKFDVIYYEYGSLVMLYDDPKKATIAYNVLREGVFDDKQLLVIILPNIQSYMIPDNVTPLLVLVNVKSGGQQGQELITSFRKLLNPHQVFDLMNGGPLPGLYVFRNIPYFKIMVCGGDGTVGWALGCLDNVCQDAKCQSPPMAIIPLGTGNDLARVLRWGPGYNGQEHPINLLRDLIEADEIKLDRWTVIFHPNEKEVDEARYQIQQECKAASTNEDPSSIFVMNNYFGIGIDADLCLDFHMAREENPDKFSSRLHNKSVYFKMGLRKMVNRRSCKDLHKNIIVEVDGKRIDLPPVEGIIILNILSWGSGANPWGPEREDQFSKPNHYDGMLEIVGVSGVVHMGQIQSGLRSAARIAQGGHIRIQLLDTLPVQVDGEPWNQPPGHVVVLRSALKATMLKKSKNKIKRRTTEASIYFPNDPNLSAQSPCADGDSSGACE